MSATVCTIVTLHGFTPHVAYFTSSPEHHHVVVLNQLTLLLTHNHVAQISGMPIPHYVGMVSGMDKDHLLVTPLRCTSCYRLPYKISEKMSGTLL